MSDLIADMERLMVPNYQSGRSALQHTVTARGFVVLPENADVPAERVLVPMTAEDIAAILDDIYELDEDRLLDSQSQKLMLAYAELTGDDWYADREDDQDTGDVDAG